MSIARDLLVQYFGESTDSPPDEIAPLVKRLEDKGYQVKYSSPGHENTRFDNDRNKDGIINSKMVSTARIIFSRDYKFNKTPQGWEWKVLENGVHALYAKPYTYNEKMGSPEKAFKSWQVFYMSNLRDWIEKLPHAGDADKDKDTEPDTNFA